MQEFTMKVNKIREAVVTVTRSLNSVPLNGDDYEMFSSQDECLKKISNALNILKPSIEEINSVFENVASQLRREQAEQIRRLSDKLRDEWINVNQSYVERYNRWNKCYEKWKEISNTCRTFSDWLDKTEESLRRLNSLGHSKVSKTKIFELEQEISRMQRTMNNINVSSASIFSRAKSEDVVELKEMAETIKRRWQNIITDLNARKEKYVVIQRMFILYSLRPIVFDTHVTLLSSFSYRAISVVICLCCCSDQRRITYNKKTFLVI